MESPREFTLDDHMANLDRVTRFGRVEEWINTACPDMMDVLRREGKTVNDLRRMIDDIRAIDAAIPVPDRRAPKKLGADRRREIATAAGVGVDAVDRFIADFEEVRAIMCEVARLRRGP